MAEITGTRPARATKELIRDLRDFLAMEAPYLLPEIPLSATPPEIESFLLTRVDRLFRVSGSWTAEPIFPGTDRAGAAETERLRMVEAVRGFFERQRLKESITDEERVVLFRTMLYTRLIDDALKGDFDRKEVAWRDYPSPQKGFRSTGQEAICGAALRLRRPPEYADGPDYAGDFISPIIRDLGLQLMFMHDPRHPFLIQYGKVGTPVGGRDIHPGRFDHGVVPSAAPLAISTQTLIGMAYGFKLRGEDRVCLSTVGDGGSSLGEWHEAINFAAVRKLGMIFVVQNNQWALGTHVGEQAAVRRFAHKAIGYGMPGITIFGNDPEEIAAASAWAAGRARAGGGPTMIELVTYRRSGHAHHDDLRFRGKEEINLPGYEFADEREAWEALDPIALYERRVLEVGALTPDDVASEKERAAAAVAEAQAAAAAAPWPEPADYRSRVYAPRVEPPRPTELPAARKKMSYDEAVRSALAEMLEADERVFVLGEDVGGRYGGAFGVTRGLAKRYGAERCLNTPISESAIVGCAVGAALVGYRPVAEMQFADFLAPGFNALVNNAAKLYWRWGHAVPMVVRLPYGAATGDMERLLGGGPYHSQCPEMWFVRTPGWRIVAPSNPIDAKGLMIAAIRDENPVIYLESKGLYGFHRTDLRDEVPLGVDWEVPIGEAAVRREGEDATLLTYGAHVWTALAAAESLAPEASIEVIDLRTLAPLDEATITASVRKTNRVLVLHEDTRTGGLAGELAARLADDLFFFLDAPIRRVTAPDTPSPYAPPLEYDYIPKEDEVVAALRDLLAQ